MVIFLKSIIELKELKKNVFYIEISNQIYDSKYFVPSDGLYFHFLSSVLWSMKLLNFDAVQFNYFFIFVICASGIIFKNTLPNTSIGRLIDMFRSYTYAFDSFCVTFCTWCEIRVQTHSFSCGYAVVPAQFVKKIFFPQWVVLALSLKINLALHIWIYFWTLNSIPLIYISIFMPVPHNFDYYITPYKQNRGEEKILYDHLSSFGDSLEIRDYKFSKFFFFSYCFGYLELLANTYKYWSVLSYFWKTGRWDFDKIAMEL